MLRNYLKIAWRNLVRHKVYSAINIGGLAVGMAISMLILLFVAHEHSFDNFRPNANRIYRVWSKTEFGGQEYTYTKASPALGTAVKKKQPGVEEVVRIYSDQTATFKTKQQLSFTENRFAIVDPAFFWMFGVPLLRGNVQTALSNPMTLVISEQTAQKYFGKQDPVGQVLMYNDTLAFTVTGVMQTPLSNSILQFDLVSSIESYPSIESQRGLNRFVKGSALDDQQLPTGGFETYFLVKDESVASRIPQLISDLIYKQSEGRDKRYRFFTQPLPDIHLGANFSDVSNVRLVNILSLVAILIVVLALANYMNLTTARSSIRAKEVGVRKVSGASQRSLIIQFYGESVLTTLIGFALGLLFFYLLKPHFLTVLQQTIDQSFIYSPSFVIALLLLFLFTAIMAGSYPALLLASFAPVDTLKGRFSLKPKSVQTRRAFTVLQFVASIALISSCLVIQQQVNFFQNTDIGLQKSRVLALPFTYTMSPRLGPYIEAVNVLPDVAETTIADIKLFKNQFVRDAFYSPTDGKELSIGIINADISFLNFFKIEWADAPADENEIGTPNTLLINEAAMKQSGSGKGGIWSLMGNRVEATGVVKNFNYTSLHSPVEPAFIFLYKQPNYSDYFGLGGCVYIRTKPDANLGQLLKSLTSTYTKFDQKIPFEYYFLEEAFDSYYKAEQRLSNVFYVITGIALVIACLGLFGLAAFTAEQRSKEIGIRKVLGASVVSIVTLLSRDFMKLVVIAILVATPVAWYAMNQWLSDFAYKINIEWWVFALAGLLAVGIALLTVSFQSIKAALMNPVESLRGE